jgi:CBS domain-containing protein
MTTLAQIAAQVVDDVDRPKPIRVTPDTTVFEVVQQLHEHKRGAVLVEQAGDLVGIFTERDLMTRVDQHDPLWQTVPVGEVMTKSPKTIRTDETLEQALNLMLVGVYRHLPTVTPDGKTEGMVSIVDLLVHITEFFPDDFVNLPVDPDHETSGPWGG